MEQRCIACLEALSNIEAWVWCINIRCYFGTHYIDFFKSYDKQNPYKYQVNDGYIYWREMIDRLNDTLH